MEVTPPGSALPVHFFTIVLNGEPFIRYHLDMFRKLPFAWHWHIVEGLAELKHDTGWSLKHGGTAPMEAARDGRSVDGTAEYLDQIVVEEPGRVTVYRSPGGRLWEGKLEMVAAPLANIAEKCLLWEVDSDELWTVEQIVRMRDLFLNNPDRTGAVLWCQYFVGPGLGVNRRRKYTEIEWRRVWRFEPGMKWAAHEPPVLAVRKSGTEHWTDVLSIKPITPAEAQGQGLVFQHFAYVTEEQLRFKETYYGYSGILEKWKELQKRSDFPVALKEYFDWPWVNPGAMVDPVDVCGVVPLAHVEEGKWVMRSPVMPWERVPAAEAELEKRRYFSVEKLGNYQLVRKIREMDLKRGAMVGIGLGGTVDAVLKGTGVERVQIIREQLGSGAVEGKEGERRNVEKFLGTYGERVTFAESIEGEVDFLHLNGNQGAIGDWFEKVRVGGILCGHWRTAADAAAAREFWERGNLLAEVRGEGFWSVRKPEAQEPKAVTVVGPEEECEEKEGRGVLMMVWGTKFDGHLMRALHSIRGWHPELTVQVRRMPEGSSLLDKARMFEFTPFEETLFLDVDTVVLDRLDFGFEMARKHGLACCINECPWARRYGSLSGEMIEYNTGVQFFTTKAKEIYQAWYATVKKLDSSIRFLGPDQQIKTMVFNDQAGFAKAISDLGASPLVLPMNWNFRPAWHRSLFGPMKVWHDYGDVPAFVQEWNNAQRGQEKMMHFTLMPEYKHAERPG